MSEQSGWLDCPRNVTALVRVLYAACAALLVAEVFVHRHAHFGFEETFGFYALVGFFAYCGIVLSAKLLRRWLHRDEDYYRESGGAAGEDRDG